MASYTLQQHVQIVEIFIRQSLQQVRLSEITTWHTYETI